MESVVRDPNSRQYEGLEEDEHHINSPGVVFTQQDLARGLENRRARWTIVGQILITYQVNEEKKKQQKNHGENNTQEFIDDIMNDFKEENRDRTNDKDSNRPTANPTPAAKKPTPTPAKNQNPNSDSNSSSTENFGIKYTTNIPIDKTKPSTHKRPSQKPKP